jgi:hypothetical protein
MLVRKRRFDVFAAALDLGHGWPSAPPKTHWHKLGRVRDANYEPLSYEYLKCTGMLCPWQPSPRWSTNLVGVYAAIFRLGGKVGPSSYIEHLVHPILQDLLALPNFFLDASWRDPVTQSASRNPEP